MMNVKQIVAWNLRRIRVERALSQEAFAVDARVDRTYVGRLERGQENPTILVLERLAKALGVTVAELVTAPRAGEQRPKPLPGGRPKQVVRKKRR